MVRVKHKAILILTAIVAGVALLEASCRFYQYVVRNRVLEDAIFHPCYRHYYFFGPNFKPNSGGAWQAIPNLKINSLGFRGGEFTIEKQPGIYRIICLGGSTSHAGNYPEKLSALLKMREESLGKKVEVINAAVPAWNTTQSLIQFVTRAIYLQPDLIIIYHATNDHYMEDNYWLHRLPEVDYKEYGGFLRNHSLLYCFALNRIRNLSNWVKSKRWKSTLRGASAAASDGADRSDSTQVYAMNLENFAALAKYRGIGAVFVTMPVAYDEGLGRTENAVQAGYMYRDFKRHARRIGQHNDVMRQLAQKLPITLVDVARSGFSGEAEYFVDLVHFSEEGAHLFAKRIASAIYPLIKEGN